MQLVELTSLLVQVLRENIPSPHSTGQWIYSDYPRIDATFPRISVTQVTGSLTEIGIGEWTNATKGKLFTVDYDIDVWVKVDDRAIINSETYVGTKLRDKYTEMIINTFLSKKEELKNNYGLIDLEITNISTSPLDEENMLHRKTITIRVTSILNW